MRSRPQRELIDVNLPEGFDPAVHENALLRLIADEHGNGWELENINLQRKTATAARMVEINELSENTETGGDDIIEIRLTRNTKPSDGEKMARKLEEQHKGYYLTEFEPFLGWAILTRLSTDAARARGAVANALGVKPWEVQIADHRHDDGFTVKLPKSYVPSKHEGKLQEVAESVVGKEGWFVDVDARKLTAEIIPADPPTFPAAFPYPFSARIPAFNPKGDWGKIPLGRKLGKGKEPGDELVIDLGATAHGQIAGISGGGKTVAINGFAYGLLARGFELGVVDVKAKAVDFEWLRPFVRPGGWGCESIAAGVATLSLAIAEGERRAELIRKHGVQKWQELPASLGIKPIVIIMDEVTALFMMEEIPKGLPKDHALVVDSQQVNLEKAVLRKLASRIAAEWRFAGVHLYLATQMAQNNTGIPPTIKINLGNRLLFGANPNDAARGHAFQDARSVPKVPSNIQVNSTANRGVGAAELEGQGAPAVFKSYFATTDDYHNHLEALGAPKTTRPEPTATEIARYTPTLEASDSDDRPVSRFDEGGFGHTSDRDTPRLKGAAAAAHELKAAEQSAKRSAAAAVEEDFS